MLWQTKPEPTFWFAKCLVGKSWAQTKHTLNYHISLQLIKQNLKEIGDPIC
jgi:hypothetical protein